MHHDQLPVLTELIAVLDALAMTINKKPRVGGRGGVSVLSVSYDQKRRQFPFRLLRGGSRSTVTSRGGDERIG
jgi:hypothetical protein